MTGSIKTTAPARRLTSLDAVRGIASFVVVLCHCLTAIPDEARARFNATMWSPLIDIFTNGDAAVIIFFVLSGYVLALPFFRGTQPSYPRYLSKRFCRIYIPFAVTVFIAALLARFTYVGEPLAGVGDWLNDGMSRRAVVPSVLVGHFLMVGTKQDIALNFPMWTLVHEMRISLIFPLLIVLCSALCLAPHRPGTHAVRRGHLWHDPAETAQDRRIGPRQRAADQDRHGIGLPVAGRVRSGARAIAQRHRLTNQTGHRRHMAPQTPPRSRRGAARPEFGAFVQHRETAPQSGLET